MIHLLKNLVSDVLDRKTTRVFWATTRILIEIKSNQCMQTDEKSFQKLLLDLRIR